MKQRHVSLNWALATLACVAFVAAGCGGGAKVPSGTVVSGSTSPGASAGGGSAGGAVSASGLRIVAWDPAQALPIGTAGQSLWMFMNDTGNLDTQTLDILVNGQSVAQGAATLNMQAMQLNKGFLFQLDPVPASGDTLQVTVNDTAGTAVLSNVMTVSPGAYAAGNTPVGTTNQFAVLAPAYGDSAKGTTPTITFKVAAQATSYQVVILQVDPATGNLSDIPVAAEIASTAAVSGLIQFVVGTAANGTNPTIEAANGALANPGDFLVHVVALDATGWGVGTTADVDGYNALPNPLPNPPTQGQIQVISSWPYFTSN